MKRYCTINGYDRNNQFQAAFSYFSAQFILLKDNITRVHLWRCEFLLIGGDFNEQSQCRMHIGEIRKESNIWTFSVHYATLWTLIPQPHILSWETPIKIEHFLRTSALLFCIPNWKHIRINFINKNNSLIDSTEQYQIMAIV